MNKSLFIIPVLLGLAVSSAAIAGEAPLKFVANDSAGRNNVTFKSEAPLEDIVGTTNQLTGHINFDPGNPGKGASAEFTVPVASMTTGIPLRDEHMKSKGWLNAADYPEIRLRLDRVTEAELVSNSGDARTFNLKVSGELTLHGSTAPVEVAARVSYLPESEQTRKRLPGDLLAVRARFPVRLADFGITGPEGSGTIGSKVGETIEIEVRLVAGTEPAPGSVGAGSR